MKFFSKILFFWVNLLAIVISIDSYGQNSAQNKNLAILDSVAFQALEIHSNLTTKYANNLLNESLKYRTSIYSVNAYIILGIVNKEKGYYITSLNFYLKALNKAKLIKDQSRISACLNNIGSIYQLQHNFEKAKFYFYESLKIENQLNNQLQKSIRYYNLGEVYSKLDSLALAISFFNNSLVIEKNERNREGVIYALLGLSGIYIKIKRMPEAEFSLAAVKSKLGIHNLEELILYNKLMGDLKYSMSNLNEALTYYQEAARISEEYNFRIYLSDIYCNEMKLLKKLRRFEEFALKADMYVEIQEELYNVKIKNQLEDLTLQNSLDKKKSEVSRLKKKNDLLNQRI
jgi:tetratricopeptide (TPR) repeat protein